MLPYQGYDYAYSIRRELFDGVMFDHAAALPGVETRLSFNVTGLLQENGRVVGLRGSAGGRAEEEIRADIVIGADGANSLVARETGAQEYNVLPARNCVYFAYYSGVLPAGNEATATIYFDQEIRAAFIISDSDSNLTVISLSLPASRFQEARQNADELHWKYGRLIPGVGERIAGAHRETPMYGVPPRAAHYRFPYGPGWALVGDAGYYKDPLPGQGIHDALRSSELLCQSLLEYRATGRWDRAMRRYRRARDAETIGMYQFTDRFSDLERPFSGQERRLFRAVSDMPHWSDRFVSLFNGVTDPRRFLRPANIAVIFTEWQARAALQNLTGRPLLSPPRGSSEDPL